MNSLGERINAIEYLESGLTHLSFTLRADRNYLLKFLSSQFRNDDLMANLERYTVGERPDGSYITNFNLEIETAISDYLRSRFSQDGIRGEETTHFQGTSDYTWLINPLDGTRNYVTMGNRYATGLTLLEKGTPVAGYMYNLYSRTSFLAKEGISYMKKKNYYKINVDEKWRKLNRSLGPRDDKINRVLFHGKLNEEIERVKSAKGFNYKRVHGSSLSHIAQVVQGLDHAYVGFSQSGFSNSITQLSSLFIQNLGGNAELFDRGRLFVVSRNPHLFDTLLMTLNLGEHSRFRDLLE